MPKKKLFILARNPVRSVAVHFGPYWDGVLHPDPQNSINSGPEIRADEISRHLVQSQGPLAVHMAWFTSASSNMSQPGFSQGFDLVC